MLPRTSKDVVRQQTKVFDQSHRIEGIGAIFMEQNMRFGLILGRLAILKKKLGPIMSNF